MNKRTERRANTVIRLGLVKWVEPIIRAGEKVPSAARINPKSLSSISCPILNRAKIEAKYATPKYIQGA